MRFFLFLCFIIGLTACNSSSINSFRIDGYVAGAEDSELIKLYYFSLINGEWYEIADTSKIINGKFFFEGNIDELTAATLCFDDSNSNVIFDTQIYLEPTKMTLRINKSQPYDYVLTGTKVEKENIELRKELESCDKVYFKSLEDINHIIEQINLHDNDTLVRDSLVNIFSQLRVIYANNRAMMNKILLDFVSRNNTYRIAPDLIYLLTKSETLSIDTLKYIYNSLPEQSKMSLMGKLALKQIEYFDSKINKKDTSIGNPAPDFARKEISGKTITLSDFIGKKFVLLDFWASWCVPCIKEIPKIKELFNQYGEQGFTVISISLDEDKNKWLNAINQHQLEQWPQILSVEENNAAFNIDDISFLYNVELIPHFFLIDKQGTIIANGVGGELLIEIDRILKENLNGSN